MNVSPYLLGKGVPGSPVSMYISDGNFLHTGGVVGSTPSAPTIFQANRLRAKEVPLGPSEPIRGLPMPRHRDELPDMTERDWQRFWSKVDRSAGLFGCWEWQGGKSGQGYGRFKVAGRLWSPHRIAVAAIDGGIPPSASYHGFVVMHSCDNPSCCNPAHLKIGTHSENVRDMDRKGRRVATTLTTHPPELIAAIRRSRLSSRAAAKHFGVSDGYIRQLRRGEGRKDSPPL